jgi:hypothetical protein
MLPDPTNYPEVREVAEQAQLLAAVGERYSVATAEEFTVAGDELRRIKAAQKRLDEVRKGITRPIDAAKKAILDLFREPEAKLAAAESGVKRAMLRFQAEQDRLRQEDQRKADEAARKERERLEAQAARAAAAGKIEKAEALEVRAATVSAPVIHREAPKVAGLSTREVWRYEIVDATALPREYLTPDTTKIGKVVQALRGDTTIPGVRVFAERQLAARA